MLILGIRLWHSVVWTQNGRQGTWNHVVWGETMAKNRVFVLILSHMHCMEEEQEPCLLTYTKMAPTLDFTSQCTPGLLSHPAASDSGGFPPTTGRLSNRRIVLSWGEGSSIWGQASYRQDVEPWELKQCFWVALANEAGIWGGAEQALRSKLAKEKKEREANRNHTAPVCSCNLTWLSPLLAKGAHDVNIHYHVIFDWLPEFIILSAVMHWILTKPIPLPKKGLCFLIFTE